MTWLFQGSDFSLPGRTFKLSWIPWWRDTYTKLQRQKWTKTLSVSKKVVSWKMLEARGCQTAISVTVGVYIFAIFCICSSDSGKPLWDSVIFLDGEYNLESPPDPTVKSLGFCSPNRHFKPDSSRKCRPTRQGLGSNWRKPQSLGASRNMALAFDIF